MGRTYEGNFNVTAYCSCRLCCGIWADNRPDGIVYTASGAEAVQGVTVAAGDTYAYGDVLYIESIGERIVQDRGGAIKNNCIDIYFESHDAALEFGRKNLDIWKIN